MIAFHLLKNTVLAIGLGTALWSAGSACANPLWVDLGAEEQATTNTASERKIKPAHAHLIHLNLPAVRALVEDLHTPSRRAPGNPLTLTLPMPNGVELSFRLEPTQVMAPELAARYPQIRTFSGTVDGQPGIRARFDLSPRGLRAQIFTPQGEVYIDPLSHESSTHQIYYTRELSRTRHRPSDKVRNLHETEAAPPAINVKPIRIGTQLLTYRLAIATTGQYAKYHDPRASTHNKGLVLAELVTLTNRVTGIFERDLGIRLQLVANNDKLIYTNGRTDPYTNSDEDRLLEENIPVLRRVIGDGAFDIGHVLSTGGSGLANKGSVCHNSAKAGGTSGDSEPETDAFYVDYVAHEIGHQFGADHTFNGTTDGCAGNREPRQAYEPGSGSTIMGYAGICSPQNIATHSDANFHAASIAQIVQYTRKGTGKNCAKVTASGNTPPSVKVPTGGFTIPAATPFELIGEGSDADGDHLSYQWEQMDLGAAGHPNRPDVSAPLFRSFPPSTSPVRVFPQLSTLLANKQVMGEILPTVSRELHFRLTVRDNHVAPSAGGVTTADLAFHVTADAGPFRVLSPNAPAVYAANSQLTVQWDVADTDVAPVSCPAVNILLSTNGGSTYSTLATQVPNTGAYTVKLPATVTSKGRIKVKCSNNVFFDVSNAHFTIQ